MSVDEGNEWGVEKLEVLLSQYGEEKTLGDKLVGALVDRNETKIEFENIKSVVLSEGYPRENLETLWCLVKKYHGASFPDMIRLVQLALTSPIHTSDCERIFSLQNKLKTSSPNRLTLDRLQQIMTIKLEGPPMKEMNFQKVGLISDSPQCIHEKY